MNKFNLTYYHKETNQVLNAYKITSYQYKIRDPLTGEIYQMTGNELFKKYVSDKKNRGLVLRKVSNRPAHTLTKEFNNYLNGNKPNSDKFNT